MAHAVRASSAVPFAFQPVRVSGATWVDDGLLSNFPVELFDRTAGRAPRWPTFGIRLAAPARMPPAHTVRGPLSLAFAALETLISDQDSAYSTTRAPCGAPSSCRPSRSARSTST